MADNPELVDYEVLLLPPDGTGWMRDRMIHDVAEVAVDDRPSYRKVTFRGANGEVLAQFFGVAGYWRGGSMTD